MPKKYYTRKETAAFLGVSVQTIENYVKKGLLTPLYPPGQGRKIGGMTVRFDGDQVENFFKPSTDDFSDC